MTKHIPDDALKCHLNVEEPKKLVKENALVVCDVQAKPELESKLEVTQIKTKKPKSDRQDIMVPELHNLEAYPETEKPIKINLDLDLYQMEKV